MKTVSIFILIVKLSQGNIPHLFGWNQYETPLKTHGIPIPSKAKKVKFLVFGKLGVQGSEGNHGLGVVTAKDILRWYIFGGLVSRGIMGTALD